MRSHEKTADVNATERAAALERAWAGPPPTIVEAEAWDAWHPAAAGHQVERILESFVTCWTCNEVRADPRPEPRPRPAVELLEIVAACRQSLERAYHNLDAIEVRASHVRPMDVAAIRGIPADRGLLAIVEKAEAAIAGAVEVVTAAQDRGRTR
jgi:hypothetical protein